MAQHVKEVREMGEMMDEIQYAVRPRLGLPPRPFLPLPIAILPIGDSTERESTPWCTVGLVFVNVAVMLYMLFSVTDLEAYARTWGLIPSQIWAKTGLHTFITSMFLHGGLLHIIGNMLFLLIFGDNVEDAFGHIKFVFFYLLSGICAGLVFAAIHPALTDPAIGASGAIAGVIGAYFVLYPGARIKTLIYGKVIFLPAFLYLGFWFLMQLVYLHLQISYEAALYTAFAAHVGGFVVGLVLAVVFKMTRRAEKTV
jgi:membrane associated rhomboid family serine protease